MTTKITFKNNFDKYPLAVAKRLDQVIRKVALDIQADAQGRAPVDTGALKNGIYVNYQGQDGYADAAALVLATNPKAELYEDQPIEQDLVATVNVALNYGFFVENGTVKMGAQPYFQPAIDDNEGPFKAACAQVIRQAGDDIKV